MPAEQISESDAKAYEKGRESAERLQAALAAHGIVLPSLAGAWFVQGTAMVELGGCRADVADVLSAILEAAAPKGAEDEKTEP
ncbi:hypothetical protein ACIQ9J_06695 [Streptomyces sp. NPDC094153]|uniref:hypothetical protein n=1 Tax=Streptomyces sp. NPDC094153 TaxID=3366058 RepID=UPI0038234F54